MGQLCQKNTDSLVRCESVFQICFILKYNLKIFFLPKLTVVKNITSLKYYIYLGMKISLETLRDRLRVVDSRYHMTKFVKTQRVPLFKAEIQLAIPNVVLRPSLEDIQVTEGLHMIK